MSKHVSKQEILKDIDFDLHPDSGPGWQRRRSDYAKQFNYEESRTEQAHKDACDINVLMARYEKGGEVPVRDDQPYFGDFVGIGDYQSAKNAVIEAEYSFSQLPASVKKRFDQDPQKLLMFLEDMDNREEAVRLGLIQVPDLTPNVGDPLPPKGDSESKK